MRGGDNENIHRVPAALHATQSDNYTAPSCVGP